jgi:hypothetical protein
VAAPRITITCDCGEKRRVGYGESYTCTCGRCWSTSSIPAEEYQQIETLERRYKVVGWAIGSVFGLLQLAVLLTHPSQIIFVLPATMIIWFSVLRPIVRRRYWKRVQTLTRSWKLRPEKAA